MAQQSDRNSIHQNAIPIIEQLSLNDEDGELEIEADNDAPQTQKQFFCLVERFLTNRPIKVKTMMNKMGEIWQPGRGMDIEEAYPGLFIFKFFHQIDVQHILKQGPWSFDNHTLVLNTLLDDDDPRDVPLFNIPFWIQVHNLPAGYMSQKTGKNIGDFIGEFLEYDEKNDNCSWRKYMRIRVLVDVRLPLKRHKKIKKQGDGSKLVQFKYERLGTFCYVCGILGHSDAKCPKLFEHTEGEIKREWSPDLRAEMGRRQGGESRWLRHGGDPDWVAPNPALMSHYGGSSKSGNNETSNNEGISANHGERRNGMKLADIFRTPANLFPKQSETNNHAVNMEENMEEDDDEALIIEGDRKWSKKAKSKEQIEQELLVHEGKGQMSGTSEIKSNHNQHFLMAGPGGARQG
jgi:14-3-3 protein epsilon